eukprot:Rhum_TRINITY_DN10916_c1_g1::Rhum_TRINITY_DN10916_c1_g1_i1::g.41389::m.41389
MDGGRLPPPAVSVAGLKGGGMGSGTSGGVSPRGRLTKVDSSICISAMSEGTASTVGADHPPLHGAAATLDPQGLRHRSSASPRRLQRMESLPYHVVHPHDQVVRVNCLYVSRRQLRAMGNDSFSLGQLGSSAAVVLAPGIQAPAQVVKASKAVKAYQVFDYRVKKSRPQIADLESEIRRNLNIPLGVELDLQVIPPTGDHALRVTTNSQLSAALAAHQEEITIQVLKSGKRLYLPWIAIIVSLADICTTVFYASKLLHRDSDTEVYVGAAVLCSVVLAVLVNLVQAFLHMKKSILSNGPTHEWVSRHVCETAFGLLLAGFNILNLECLWSHLDIVKKLNFHCPMPVALQRMSGKNSIPSLLLGDVVPIAASIFEMINRDVEWYNLASVGTSFASLSLAVAKKVIVVLFVARAYSGDGDTDDDDTGSSAGEQAARRTVDEAYGGLLHRKEVTVVRFTLQSLQELEQRSRLLGALSCKFHEVGFMAVRSAGGSVLAFTEHTMDAVFNAPRESAAHAADAVASALRFLRAWPDARRHALGPTKVGMFNVTVAAVSGEAFVGALGPQSRREFQVVGDPMRVLNDFAGLGEYEGVEIVCNESVSVAAKRDANLVRQVDVIRNVSTGELTPVYEVLEPTSVLAKRWGGIQVNLWDSLFGSLTTGTVGQSLDILKEYLKIVENDAVCEGLLERLLSLQSRGVIKYYRDNASRQSVWGEPEDSPGPGHTQSVSMSPQMYSTSDFAQTYTSHHAPAIAAAAAAAAGRRPTVTAAAAAATAAVAREWSMSPEPTMPPPLQPVRRKRSESAKSHHKWCVNGTPVPPPKTLPAATTATTANTTTAAAAAASLDTAALAEGLEKASAVRSPVLTVGRKRGNGSAASVLTASSDNGIACSSLGNTLLGSTCTTLRSTGSFVLGAGATTPTTTTTTSSALAAGPASTTTRITGPSGVAASTAVPPFNPLAACVPGDATPVSPVDQPVRVSAFQTGLSRKHSTEL